MAHGAYFTFCLSAAILGASYGVDRPALGFMVMWLQEARSFTMTDVGTLQMCCLWAQALLTPVYGVYCVCIQSL